MLATLVKFKDGKCFKDHFGGFDEFKPINVVIGRNNSGKSRILDFVKLLCKNDLGSNQLIWEFSGALTETALRRYFNENTSQGRLEGNHWRDHGKLLIGKVVNWHIVHGEVSFEINEYQPSRNHQVEAERKSRIENVLKSIVTPLNNRIYRRILADRDIQSESSSISMDLDFAGNGATNIIRRYLRSTSEKFSRNLIQKNVLEALNEIFSSDGNFTEIQIGDHDEHVSDSDQDYFEVYLGERNKGLVALSESGSGLKTVLLVLLNLIVVPDIEERSPSGYVYAFEELENNLHPSLLRRLLAFVTKYVIDNDSTLFLTTHSSTALDMFGANSDAQIIHVEHDGRSSRSKTVSSHFNRVSVVAGLGARPSDLLQSNGILWLEGPSDRIYLNRWIELFSNGGLREGHHYQCAFYGGSVLARTEFVAPNDGVDDLVNLANINSNVVVVCDSDRTKLKDGLKDRVIRIQKEVGDLPNAFVWVTEAKEIENYILGSQLQEFCGLETEVPNPRLHQRFFPSKKLTSFMGKELNRKTIDKVELAISVTPKMTLENMSDRFDLKESIEMIIQKIRSWNT